ncbi:hypothetical protein ACFYTU_53615 [Nonomuraea angiospora]|uniref:hypothetical protein n=1 Tax=Nonomuraea angiospora TaxID=46172 RepID=UPI0036CBBE13
MPSFDAVEAKGIDPVVILGQLIALARETPYGRDLVRTATVYPPPEGAPATVEEWEALPEDSPYKEGPMIEEFAVFPPALRVLAELRDLARRAREEGEMLYCRFCV